MRIKVLTAAAVLVVQSLSLATASTINSSSPIGMNTNEAMDINSSMPFVDLFKLSLPFEEARPWLTKGNIKYDDNGWPIALNGGHAGTRFISNLPANTIPEGVYTVLYKGKGKLKYGVDAKLISRSDGKDLIRIKPGKNKRISASITIIESDPSNYLHDIHILLPGGVCKGDAFKRIDNAQQCGRSQFLAFEQHHKDLRFNPDYLNFMKDFKVIRLMNMSGITRNAMSKWSQRPHVDQSTWGGKEGVRGVPLEVMIDLANQLNADPWFNIPHKADNEFVRKYAAMVTEQLKPGLKSYVEYTNEAWNGIFTQHHYMIKKGLALKLDKDRINAGHKYFSMRSVEIFKMWEQVAGGTDKFIRVMGGMTTNANMTEMLLGYQNAYKYTDAIAIAPYFYINNKDIQKVRSVNTIFRELRSKKNRHSVPNILKYVKTQGEHAKRFGVDLIAYEGGQHLVAYNTHTVRDGPNPYLIKANKDKRMAELYYEFLHGWKQAGGKLFVAFSAPRIYTWIGSWGIKEYITQPASEAPKYRALLAFSKNEPCWWAACSSYSGVVHHNKPSINPGLKTMARLFKPIKGFPKGTQPQLGQPQVAVARTTPLDPFDPGPEVMESRELINTHAPVITKVISHKKPVIKSLPSVIDTVTSSLTKGWKPAEKASHRVSIPRVTNSRSIFSRNSPHTLRNIISGNISGGRDLAASWQAHWDSRYLHLRVDVSDDNFIKDSNTPWGDDSIEIFIDADGSRLASYDKKNDFMFMYRWKDYGIGLGKNSPRRNTGGIKQKMSKLHNGYVLETSIPWNVLGVRPMPGRSIGIDIQINDDDDGNQRDGKLAWKAKEDNSWNNPQLFGQLVLAD